MVILTFEIDEAILKRDLRDGNLSDVPEDILDETVLMMPTCFCVNDKEIFLVKHVSGKNFSPGVPLLYTAGFLFDQIESLPFKKEFESMVPEGGYLGFKMLNQDTAQITYGLRRDQEPAIKATVNYQELFEAFLTFKKKVKLFLLEKTPDLKKHPYWGPWLTGDRYGEAGKVPLPD